MRSSSRPSAIRGSCLRSRADGLVGTYSLALQREGSGKYFDSRRQDIEIPSPLGERAREWERAPEPSQSMDDTHHPYAGRPIPSFPLAGGRSFDVLTLVGKTLECPAFCQYHPSFNSHTAAYSHNAARYRDTAAWFPRAVDSTLRASCPAPGSHPVARRRRPHLCSPSAARLFPLK